MDAPPVQYVTTSDGFNIAYTVAGEGRPFVMMPYDTNHVRFGWGHPWWLEGLVKRFRLVYYDGRGQGLSTRGLPDGLTPSEYKRDLEAVVDGLKLDDFVLFAPLAVSSHLAVHYAVDHADKVRALILLQCCVSASATSIRSVLGLADENWDLVVRLNAPTTAPALLARHYEFFRQATTREDFRRRLRPFSTFDLSDVLPRLRVPTLVLHARDSEEWRRAEESAKVAALIPGARFVPVAGDQIECHVDGLKAIDDFLASLPALKEQPAPPGTPPARLSLREVEVLRLVAAGRSNPQIADELVISLNTVQRHVSNILAKTGCANRTEAGSYAHRHALV